MKIRSILLAMLLLFLLSLPLRAADVPPSPAWDQVLDRAYLLTWQGKETLDAELKKEEQRIGQDLPGYMAAWEQRMATPIVYEGKSRGGSTCGPLTYCTADFLDPRSLMAKLREKKDAVAAYIFEKLSRKTQNAIIKCDLRRGKAAAKAEGDVVEAAQLLADDLTKIVNTENLHDSEQFEWVPLSYAAVALVNEHDNERNRLCINKTLLADAFPDELARNFKCVIQKDATFRRLVAARTLQYLRTGDRKLLDEGIALAEKYRDKIMYTDFAFWYHYPRVLADIDNGNADALTRDAYFLLDDAVLGGDPQDAGNQAPAELERRFYGRNLAEAILLKAIRDEQMAGLESLGTAVWILGSRNEALTTSEREKELLQLMAESRKFLSGPDSDNYRLNYAVAMREGEKRANLLARALDGKESGPGVEKLFTEARYYLLLAWEWAETGQGRTTAATSYLGLVNLALARMGNVLPPATYAALAAAPGKVNAATAAALYREMTEKEKGGWEELRFVDRKGYIDGAQQLWTALRKNSLLVGDYYLRKMDRDDFMNVMDSAEMAERAFLRYVDLFEECTGNGHRDMVPDSAYFAYGEALKMLSRLKRTMYAYNKNIELHNKSVNYLLQAIFVYPYDDKIAEYAAMNRNINTYIIDMSPDNVIAKVLSNKTTARCLDDKTSFCDKSVKETFAWNAYKVKHKLYDSSSAPRPGDIAELASAWGDRGQTTGVIGAHDASPAPASAQGSATKQGEQRKAVLGSAARYAALAEQLSALTASAREKFARCRATSEPCEEIRGEVESLLSKREELEKGRNELEAACAAYRQSPGSDAEGFAAQLEAAVNDEYYGLTDKAMTVVMEKKLYDLGRMDDHAMHKIIRNAYYMNQ